MMIKNVKRAERNLLIHAELKGKELFNTCEFSNHDNNKFILLLRKGVYLHEYMNYWEKFNETSLHEKYKISTAT